MKNYVSIIKYSISNRQPQSMYEATLQGNLQNWVLFTMKVATITPSSSVTDNKIVSFLCIKCMT